MSFDSLGLFSLDQLATHASVRLMFPCSSVIFATVDFHQYVGIRAVDYGEI